MDELKTYLENNLIVFNFFNKTYPKGDISQIAKISVLVPNIKKSDVINLCRSFHNEEYSGFRCIEYIINDYYDEKEEYQFIVKKPEFDDAFMAIKKLKPYLDEKTFSMIGPGEYDGDLVSIVSEAPIDYGAVIDKFLTKVKYRTEFCKVTINISNGNVNKNKIVLENLIELLNGS